MKVKDVMSHDVRLVTPNDTVETAARFMAELDVGVLPIGENDRLVGIVTDRDITCRCTAEGKGPETLVNEVMSRDPKCCGPDDAVETVEKIMAEGQVRRVPVVDNRGCCIGIIAQADLALNQRAATNRDVGQVVEQISAPAHEAGSPRAGR